MRELAAPLRLILILAVALFLSHCANDNLGSTSSASSGESSDSLPAPLNSKGSKGSDDYRIAPQDVLQVTVFQVPDLSGSPQVDGNGYVTLPLIGRMEVGGKTPEEAQKEIAGRLKKTYLQSPQVSVLVTKSGQRVTINGAVQRPAVLSVSGKLTLSQAVAEAGGLSDIGNPSRIHVARVAEEHVKDVVFDLDAIQSGKSPDPSLYGGDIVVAEQSGAKVAFKTVKDLLPFAILGSIL
jgi:polysaccharide export outer membrane protein